MCLILYPEWKDSNSLGKCLHIAVNKEQEKKTCSKTILWAKESHMTTPPSMKWQAWRRQKGKIMNIYIFVPSSDLPQRPRKRYFSSFLFSLSQLTQLQVDAERGSHEERSLNHRHGINLLDALHWHLTRPVIQGHWPNCRIGLICLLRNHPPNREGEIDTTKMNSETGKMMPSHVYTSVSSDFVAFCHGCLLWCHWGACLRRSFVWWLAGRVHFTWVVLVNSLSWQIGKEWNRWSLEIFPYPPVRGCFPSLGF